MEWFSDDRGGGFGGGGFGEFWLFSCEISLLFLKVTTMEVEGEEEALGDEGEGEEDLEVTVEVLVNYT